jgi:hypothetical protein
MSRWMKVLLALSAALLTLLLLTFLWQPYVLVADRGWVVLGGYPLALTIAWGMAFLCVLVMEGCLTLQKYSKIVGAAACALIFLAAWYFFGKDHTLDYPYNKQFLGLDLSILYYLYWYMLVVLFIVLMVFVVAQFLGPVWRTRLLLCVGVVLFFVSLWLAFMYYYTATIWCAGSLALWWESVLWRGERGTVSRMLEEKDPLAVFTLISSFVAPIVIYGLYDTLTFAVY